MDAQKLKAASDLPFTGEPIFPGLGWHCSLPQEVHTGQAKPIRGAFLCTLCTRGSQPFPCVSPVGFTIWESGLDSVTGDFLVGATPSALHSIPYILAAGFKLLDTNHRDPQLLPTPIYLSGQEAGL